VTRAFLPSRAKSDGTHRSWLSWIFTVAHRPVSRSTWPREIACERDRRSEGRHERSEFRDVNAFRAIVRGSSPIQKAERWRVTRAEVIARNFWFVNDAHTTIPRPWTRSWTRLVIAVSSAIESGTRCVSPASANRVWSWRNFEVRRTIVASPSRPSRLRFACPRRAQSHRGSSAMPRILDDRTVERAWCDGRRYLWQRYRRGRSIAGLENGGIVRDNGADPRRHRRRRHGLRALASVYEEVLQGAAGHQESAGESSALHLHFSFSPPLPSLSSRSHS